MIDLHFLDEAKQRIAPFIRHTPLVEVHPVKKSFTEAQIFLKLESMQIGGSFKVRGAVNKLKTLEAGQIGRGIVTASGGNHGIAVAYAGWIAQCPATVFISNNVPPNKIRQLESWGAIIVRAGNVWDDANRAALEYAEKENLAYIHPFADPFVIAGQGTIALEVLQQMPDLDMIVVAIGGGGLISGISLAAKALNPNITVIGVEPIGAPTLYASCKAGRLTELEEVNTAANTLAPRNTAQINLDIIRKYVDDIVLVTDEEMLEGARWLWREMGVAAELSGSAAFAALLSGRITVSKGQKVCAIVCSSGTDGLS